jgi:hypothetical protein
MIVVKRSPRYPRHNLAKAIEMTKKLFAGAHQAKIDVDAAAKVIGYSGSGGGAASSALGALRQYGLVDGLRGDVAVSDLAMRILEPMDDAERVDATREAAMKPEIFERIVSQFGGKLPGSDEPVRSFLIRQEGFSTGGADEVIETLRATLLALPDHMHKSETEASERAEKATSETQERTAPEKISPTHSEVPAKGELITLPLGQNCRAELRLIGDVTDASYARLIKHLELLREIAAEETEE